MYNQIKAYYKQLLPQLTNEEWQAIENCLTIKHLKKGEYLVKQGDVCNHVSFINKGLVRFYTLIDGKEIPSGFFMENQYTSAYVSFLTRQPSIDNVDVLEDAELLQIDYESMQMLYKNYPVFQMFGRKVAEQLFLVLSQRIDALQILTPEQRYLKLIEKSSLLLQQIPQYMLAAYIGVTPEHLSRIRKKLTQKA
jgi:CRP-like cAMP-binding protein